MGVRNLIRSVKLESTLKKAKRLCKTKRDFDYFIQGLKNERDFRELMKNTASDYWSERKRKPYPQEHTESQKAI